MARNYKILILKYLLFIAIIVCWAYDFLLIYNYDTNGGHSIGGSGVWFHERSLKTISGKLLFSNFLLIRYLTIGQIKFYVVNITFFCLICLTAVIDKTLQYYALKYIDYYDSFFISDFFKVISLLLLAFYINEQRGENRLH
jgi:cell division protein FtsW (lipid II flippase)